MTVVTVRVAVFSSVVAAISDRSSCRASRTATALKRLVWWCLLSESSKIYQMSVVVVVIPQRRRVAQGLGSSNAAQQSDIVKEIQEEVSIVQSYVGSGQEKSGDLRRNDHVVW